MNSSADVVSRSAPDALPSDITDPQSARITVLVRVDAGGDVDGLVNIVEFKVAEGDIVHSTASRIRLDPCSVGGMSALDVLEKDVVDIVYNSVSDRTNNHAAGLVAGNIANVHVRRVSLSTNAIITASQDRKSVV